MALENPGGDFKPPTMGLGAIEAEQSLGNSRHSYVSLVVFFSDGEY
jgi:hypothetical protein